MSFHYTERIRKKDQKIKKTLIFFAHLNLSPKCEDFGLNGRVLYISSYISIDKLVSPVMKNDAFSKEGDPRNPFALLLNA